MIIVNFSTKEYRRGQHRLSESIKNYPKLMLSDYVSLGSPTHAQSPYEFKLHAIKAASNDDPVVLWMDASMYVTGNLNKIEKIIQEEGYFMEEAGHYCTTWCNQRARDYFKLPNDSKYLMFSAGLLGLNFNFTNTRIWFDEWMKSAKAGCFAGNWADHRHDMVCGSIIAERMGLKYQRGGSHLSYIGPGYSKPEAESVVYCQGM